jgi:hexosaminidase
MTKILTVLTQLLFAASTLALWPMPTNIQTGNSTLLLDRGFQIQFSGGRAPSDLQDAISRTNGFLKNDKLGRLVVGRGSSDAAFFKSAKSLRNLVLSLSSKTINSISTEATKELTTRDESYELIIPGDGSDATLKANTTLGLFRGLTSFSQLWYTYQNTIYTINVPMDIKDSPAYVSINPNLGDVCGCSYICTSPIEAYYSTQHEICKYMRHILQFLPLNNVKLPC